MIQLQTITPAELAKARQIAFNILARHGDCLLDDTVMDDLIDDIANAILRAEKSHDPT